MQRPLKGVNRTMHVSEQHVQNAVTAELNRLKYRITKLKSSGEHGVDIRARHWDYARYFLVECKGDAGQSAKSPNSGREVRFLQGLGQIITRIHPARGYRYGLAFPCSYRALVLRRLRGSLLKTLKLELFFVADDNRVTRLTWRDVSDDGA